MSRHNPTDEEARNDIEMIKSTGVNWIRVSLRPAPARFLHWADHLGLLIWQGGAWTLSQPVNGDQLEQYKKWLAASILRDHNHPSLVMWEMMNEGGGNPWESLKALTAQLYDFAKSLDGRHPFDQWNSNFPRQTPWLHPRIRSTP